MVNCVTMTNSPTAFLARGLGLEPASLVEAALSTFGAELRIATSLGAEDMVVLHLVAAASRRLGVVPRVFLLDTGRLHQETYDHAARAQERYGLPIEVFFPEPIAVESLVRKSGVNGFYRSVEERKACCGVRKLGPLSRALAGASAWVTGLRREQSPTRADVATVEVDEANGGLLKVNPLASWTSEDVRRFAAANDVPLHVLHAAGYPSIGCAPCTRAVQPGEDARAGRWWWENPEHKECGLHPRGVGRAAS